MALLVRLSSRSWPLWATLLCVLLLQPALSKAQSWNAALPTGLTAENGYTRTVGTAVDAAGNTYIAGYFQGTVSFGTSRITASTASNADVFVAKASPDGQWLWAVQGGGAGFDQGTGLAVDPAGNVYVTGTLRGPAVFGSLTVGGTLTLSAAFVAKLNTNGQWQWVSKSNGTCHVYGNGIALDPAGNAYLTGNYNFTTKAPPGTGTAEFGTTTLADFGYTDLFVAKVNATGQWQWATRAGGSTGNDLGNAITVDAAGNAYVTGVFRLSALFGTITVTGGGDIFVGKVSSAGQWQWVAKATGNSPKDPSAIAVDATGHVYTSGAGGWLTFGTTRLTSTTSGEYLAKLSAATGQWVWAASSNGKLNALTTDFQGSLYVAGSLGGVERSFGSTTLSATGNSSDVLVGKVSTATGQWLWAVKAGGTGDEAATGVALDAAGNVHIAGGLQSTNAAFGSTNLMGDGSQVAYERANASFTAKLDANTGSYLWALQNEDGGEKTVNSVVTDATGNTYVAGTFAGTTTFGSLTLRSERLGNDVFIAKLSPTHQWLWAVKAGGAGYDEALALALDASGNVLVAGDFSDVSATFGSTTLANPGLFSIYADIFVGKLSAATGQWQWATRGGSNRHDHATALATDEDGNVYLTGSFEDRATFGALSLTSIGFADALVARLSVDGEWQWVTSGGGSARDVANDVALDASGNVYITGAYAGNSPTFGTLAMPHSGNGDAFVGRLGSGGQWQWVRNASTSGVDEGTSLGVDASGQVYVTGFYSGVLTLGSTSLPGVGAYTSLYVATLDPAGQWQWATHAAGPAASVSKALELDAKGGIYVTGHFYKSSTFGTTTLTSQGNADLFVAYLSDHGQWQWASGGGGSHLDYGTALAVSSAGQVYVAGITTSRDATFGESRISGEDVFNTGFLARLTVSGLPMATGSGTPVKGLQAFPNPFTNTLSLLLPAGKAEVTIVDALGRLYWHQYLDTPTDGHAVSLSEVAAAWPAGIYWLRLRVAQGQQVVQLVHY